jgi:hypothetical protein
MGFFFFVGSRKHKSTIVRSMDSTSKFELLLKLKTMVSRHPEEIKHVN